MTLACAPIRPDLRLHWKEGDRYYVRSACGRYTVCKLMLRGVWAYEGWLVATKEVLARVGTSEEAKGACEWHALGGGGAEQEK